MSWETIVNVLETGWKVIEGGKPSMEIHNSKANAVPQVDDWQALTDVQGTNTLSWRYKRTNMYPDDSFAGTPVNIGFKLRWQYGARYNGAGAFIPNCWLEVPDCSVSWLFDVDLSLTAQNPANVGSAGAPHALLAVYITGTVSQPFSTTNIQWGFNLYGDGQWQQG